MAKSIFFSALLSGGLLQADFKFSGQGSTLQLSGSAAKIILSTPIPNFSGTLKITDKSANSLQSSSTLDSIAFTGGVYESGSGSRAYITATIDPSNADAIILNANQTIDSDNGAIIEGIQINGSGAAISGQPTFNSAIVIKGATEDVTMCIQNKLNQNVTMNGGTVHLGDDLALQDGVFLAGDGTVNMHDKTLTLPAAVTTGWTGALTFFNANDLNLSGYTTLSGTWTFSGDGLTSRVGGSGNILDISNNGTIVVADNHSLYLSDIHIKGLGASGGSLSISANGGHVYLSNVTIELDGSYAFNSGNITVQGNNCVVIAKNHNKFNITSNAVLTIDGVALLFDPLGTSPIIPNPFVASSVDSIVYLNGGLIRANYQSDGTLGNIEFTIPTATGTEVLPTSHLLAPTSTLHFINEDTGTPKTITLDGQGFYIQFNYISGQYMTIDENLTVIMKNVLLKDFDPALVSFGASAKIVFDDNVTVSLGKDLTINGSTSPAFAFQGNATLRGNGTTLALTADSTLTVTGNAGSASKVLTVQDVRLFVQNATAMKCSLDTTKIVLQDVELHMNNNGCTFATGLLDIKNNVSVLGVDPTSVGGSSVFTFSSKGQLRVLTNSILKLDNGVSFNYQPDTTGDGGNAATSKRHMLLVDPSSTLWFNSCAFSASTMGFALDYGRVLVDGKTTLNINAAVGAEVEFGSALQVEIAPSGILDINGALMYTNTTFA